MLVISAALLKLDQQDMRELGLSLGHIKKLSARIQQDPSPGADKFFREQEKNLRPRVPVSSLITVSRKFVFAESYSNFCTHLHLTNQTPRPPVHAIMEHIWILHGLLTKIHKEFQVLYQYMNLRMQGKDSKT